MMSTGERTGEKPTEKPEKLEKERDVGAPPESSASAWRKWRLLQDGSEQRRRLFVQKCRWMLPLSCHGFQARGGAGGELLQGDVHQPKTWPAGGRCALLTCPDGRRRFRLRRTTTEYLACWARDPSVLFGKSNAGRQRPCA